MHKGILFTVAVACILTTACKDNQTDARKDGFSDKALTKEDSLYKEVMEGHDEGMAKIGRVRKYLQQTQLALDSMNGIPAEKQDRLYYQSLVDVQSALNYADHGMDTWMTAFNIDSAKENEALRIQYLQSELEKVNIVRKQIVDGLQQADSLFQKP